MRKTFITKMPDTPGAFLKAGQVISGADVNMDSKKARETREAVFNQMEEGEWIVCGGHGEITGYCKKNDA